MNDVVDARPLIEVACGVVLNPAGEALMAQRPAERSQRGSGNFPAAKLKPANQRTTRWYASSMRSWAFACTPARH